MKLFRLTVFSLFLVSQLFLNCQKSGDIEEAPEVEMPEEKEEEVEEPKEETPEAPEAFDIISESNPRVTTHHLQSGPSGFQIGITSNGGGVINEVVIPGLGDIMGPESDRYGRAGQVAIRDASHGGRYNPTQAGFFETLGSPCAITQTEDGKKLIVEPRPMALWHGDGQYDFTRWENIGEDPYRNDGGNSDEDGLDEEGLEGKQLDEVKSEFDYYGTYEDISGQYGISIGIVKHYYQISFIRPPGHCINQHRAGTKLWNPDAVQSDISIKAPSGVHPGSDKDMNVMTGVWSLRHDRSVWTTKYLYYRKTNGQWAITDKESVGSGFPDADNTVFILSDSNTETEGKALGLYQPKTDVNKNVIIGVNETDNSIAYKDFRGNLIKLNYDLKRIPTMSKYGFSNRIRGMINRTQLDDNVYEAYRNEVYIIYGTPKEIKDAIALLDVGLNI
ncbi:hypothetical protein [Seonamhaeicola sp. ML3]|uniref:hypothetical protein n=1 Tax=Seonamhaeicola sp. ML3 TaxID=2937786 RepID=UPI00200E9B14|nr:hypothetical protein [Seonamhaeicola sp. ML3]